MNLPKQAVDISFAQGLDTKTDPWRVSIGKFLNLSNMIFTTGMRLTKRNGYSALPSLPLTAQHLTTFNGNLTAIGTSLQAYNEPNQSWVNQGNIQPASLEVLPLIRSNTNQSQVDTAIAANGLICTVYTDQTPTSLSTPRYMYVVADSVTGQNVVQPTVIPVSSGTVTGSPRVFVLGGWFIIIFTNVISATSHLQFIAVSTGNPSIVTANTDLTNSYVSSTRLSWDAIVVNGYLFFAYDNSAGGQSIKINYLSSGLQVGGAPQTFSNAGKVTATIMSLAVDMTPVAQSFPIIYISYYDSGGSVGYTASIQGNTSMAKVISTPVQFITSGTVDNIATVSQNGVLTYYYEVDNNYGYDSTIPTHYISTNTCTQTGTVGTATILVRSVGLASKAVLVSGNPYFAAAYQSPYQNTYFLINGSGQVVAKYAYENGGGYCTVGLPSITVTGNILQFGYLLKDFLESQNTTQSNGSTTIPNIYSQTGINLMSITISDINLVSTEVAQALHLTGGFLWEYDGYVPVEHNFFLYPDSVEGTPHNTGGSMVAQLYQYQAVYTWSDNQGNIHRSAPSIPVSVDMSTNNHAFTQPTPLTPTGTGTSGAFTIVVSSATGLAIGQIITDTTNPGYIIGGSYITKIVGTTITINNPLAGSPSGDTLSVSSICSVTVNIPTLRLTYKLANPVKIELFRWSTAQEEFFQVTTIALPLINSTTIDYVTFTDTFADNQIQGNSLIYTNGNVVENIGAPSFNATTLFDDRLWGIDAEDANLLWYSKQVIESTPVEMSDLFTFYVAPSIGSQGSTGVMKCIAPMDDKLIIFKANALYYINGTGPDNTGANGQYSEPIFITAVVGSILQESIVFMPNGLMFQSDKGIWLLGRDMSVTYIGAPVERYTQTAKVQSALAIPETTQVRFTLDSGITLMYDYYYEQWGTFTNVPAISATLYQDMHTYINSSGQVFQESNGTYLDGSNPVLMSFTTSWINLAGLQGYQRAYFMYLLGEYISPHFLQISIAYNYNPAPFQATTITPNNYSPAYGSGPGTSMSPYGQETPYGGPGNKEQWRVFLNKQRCQSLQLSLQEVYDPSLGIQAGAGLYISGLNLIIGVARSFRSIGSSTSVGGNSTSQGNQ